MSFRKTQTTTDPKIVVNRDFLMTVFGESADFFAEKIQFGGQEGLIVFLTSMTEAHLIQQQIIQPLLCLPEEQRQVRTKAELEQLRERAFASLSYRYVEKEQEILTDVVEGCVVLLVDSADAALSVQINGTEKRSISEPTTQTSVRGPKDSFTESIETNISLIRRRIKNPNLQFKMYKIGKDTRTGVCICYVKGIVQEDILEEVFRRVGNIETNELLGSGSIQEYISDKTLTPFPTTYDTERPDMAVANLLNGKVVILVDGTPFSLVVPVVFADFFKVTEDYYQPFFMSSFVRLIRYLAFALSLVTPSLYVALTTYHFEMIPTMLLVSLMSQRENVPFPAVVEALMMEITFEVLREAGVRMPRVVGQTISIVGALVIGQAAVEAGFVSNAMIIVVSLTAIASYVSPIYSFSTSSRLLRFTLTIAASILGLYGILLGLVVMVAHLSSLRSFGIPYLAPFAPTSLKAQKNVLLRLPVWMLDKKTSYQNIPSSDKKKGGGS